MSNEQIAKKTPILLIILMFSLMFNAFFIGFWWGGVEQPSVPRVNAVSINRFIQKLPPVDRQLVSQSFTSKRESFQYLRRELKQTNQKLAALIDQPDQDLAMINQLMQQVRSLNTQIQENFHALVFDILPKLSMEGRKKLAEAQRWDLSTILQQR